MLIIVVSKFNVFIESNMPITAALIHAARASWTGKQRTETFLLLDKAGRPHEIKAANVTAE